MPAPDPATLADRTSRLRIPARVQGCALGLAVLAVLPYLPTLGFGFVGLDDPIYVLDNPHLGPPFDPAFLRWAITSSHDGNWFPLTWWSHAVDLALYGTWAGGHHATSLALHALATVLLFAFLRAATDRTGRAALVAALFAVHPLHVESVAWIAERKDVLSSAFGFAALWAYAAYVRSQGLRRRSLYALSCLAFAASLASKPMWVTLPCVLLLLDVWPFARLSWRAVAEKAPLFALSVASSAITWSVQRGEGAMLTGAALEPWQRAANALVSLARYARRIVWPSDLSPFYPHPFLPSEGGAGLSGLQLAAALAVLVVVAFGIARSRRGPFAIGALWFAGMLVPVLGLVQVGGQGMADRYVYAPLAGALVAVVWPLADWLERRADRPALLPRLGAAAAIAVFALLAALQVGSWRDSRTLYESALARNPRTQTLRYALAVLERDEGNDAAAIAHYRRALEVDPSSARAHNGIGVTLLKRGELAQAREHFERALELQPGLTFALNHLATVHRESGEFALAEVRLREVLRLRPNYAAALLNLAELLRERDRFAEAETYYRAALAARPGSWPAWRGWIEGLLEAGRVDDARAALARAEVVLPGDRRLQTLRSRVPADGEPSQVRPTAR